MDDGGNSVDAYVGGRMRIKRRALGYSQQRLAEALGISFQQVQNYEQGSNRINASALYRIAIALNVPVSFFYATLSPVAANGTTAANDDQLELR